MATSRRGSLEFDSRGRAPAGPWRRQGSALAAAARAGLAGRSTARQWASRMEWLAGPCATTSAGTRVVHMQQYFCGLRVYRSAVAVKTRQGRWHPTPGGVRLLRSTRTTPMVSAEDALRAAIRYLAKRRVVPLRPPLKVTRRLTFVQPSCPTVLECGGAFEEPVRAQLEVFPVGAARGRVSWVLEIAPTRGPRMEVVVSADTSRPSILFAHRTTSCVEFQGGWQSFPNETVAGEFPMDPLAAPLGSDPGPPTDWLTVPGIAVGPNAACQHGSERRLSSAAVRNAFVWCSYLHDFFVEFGFDGGLGASEEGQPVVVKAFDSQNAQAGCFDSTVDGGRPRIKLYAPTAAGGAHAALDPGILIHEYTHGVTRRLLGGKQTASPFTGIEGQGLSEGYSDYFALTVLSYLDRVNGGGRRLRVVGGAFKAGSGLRSYEGLAKDYAAGLDEYRMGMVWCGALLAARDALATEPGFSEDDADRFLWQAILDSLTEMAPRCPKHGCVTLEHAADALHTSSQALEVKLGRAGATEVVMSVLERRSIL